MRGSPLIIAVSLRRVNVSRQQNGYFIATLAKHFISWEQGIELNGKRYKPVSCIANTFGGHWYSVNHSNQDGQWYNMNDQIKVPTLVTDFSVNGSLFILMRQDDELTPSPASRLPNSISPPPDTNPRSADNSADNDSFYGDSDDSRTSFKKNILLSTEDLKAVGTSTDEESDESHSWYGDRLDGIVDSFSDFNAGLKDQPSTRRIPHIVTKVLAHKTSQGVPLYKTWFRWKEDGVDKPGAYCALCSSAAGVQYQKTQMRLKKNLPWVQEPCQNTDLLDACRKHKDSQMHVYLTNLPTTVGIEPLKKIIVLSCKKSRDSISKKISLVYWIAYQKVSNSNYTSLHNLIEAMFPDVLKVATVVNRVVNYNGIQFFNSVISAVGYLLHQETIAGVKDVSIFVFIYFVMYIYILYIGVSVYVLENDRTILMSMFCVCVLYRVCFTL